MVAEDEGEIAFSDGLVAIDVLDNRDKTGSSPDSVLR